MDTKEQLESNGAALCKDERLRWQEEHQRGMLFLNVAVTLLSTVPTAVAAFLWLFDSSIKSLPFVVGLASFFISLTSWTAWEYVYGTAFALFFPLHGARHIPQSSWLAGILAKQSIMISSVNLVFSIFTDSSSVFLDTGMFAVTLTVTISLFLSGLFHKVELARHAADDDEKER